MISRGLPAYLRPFVVCLALLSLVACGPSQEEVEREAEAAASAAAEAEREEARQAAAEEAAERETLVTYAEDLDLVLQGLEETVPEGAEVGGLKPRRAVSQLDMIDPPSQYAAEHEVIRDKLDEATFFSGIDRGVKTGVAMNALRKLIDKARSAA